ncbi:MAG TPA: hypothetical protein PKN48_03235 [Bacteroidales bacterium]|nr:hypothetical protein [Bacteroidales bacterium]
MYLTLAEHIAKSREVVAANKAKGNRHAEMFATMYDQPSRFIEEILQNTEDAYARKKSEGADNKIRFKLFSDRIEIHHNGKDFDESDLMSITTFAHTTKKNVSDVNQIGKFGIGFKSVFSVTDAPEIHCEPYHYSITDYEVLQEARPESPDECFNTLIILPFKKKKQIACFDAVKNGLKNLNEYSLLFLKKITVIEIYISGVLSISIERRTKETNKNFRTIRIGKISPDLRQGEEYSNYIIFSKQPLSEKQQPELAFKYEPEQGGMCLKPICSAPVFVYFPTKIYSRLNFILNAPFTTNPLREYIPFDKHLAPENLRILHQSTDLFLSALKTFKQKKWFDLHLLSNLPLRVEQSSEWNRPGDVLVYQAFFDALLDFFKTEAALPIAENKIARNDDVLIPHNEEIARLLDSSDLQKLYQKKYFIDPGIHEKQFDEVRNYFTEVLQIKTVDAQSFGFRVLIDTGFLHNKNLEWLRKFYKYIHKNQVLWDAQHSSEYYSLRTAAIILKQDNTFSPAYDAEKRQRVFLPTERKSLLPVINKKLLSDNECQAFFKDMGISEPEMADDVEFNVIPRLDSQPLLFGKDYVRSIEKILGAFISVSLLRKEKIVELLKKMSWVYCKSFDFSGKTFFKKPDESYFYSTEIAGYFEGGGSAYAVEKELFKKLNKKFKDAYRLLLEETGVRKFPEFKIYDEKIFEIVGFEDFLMNLTFKRSLSFSRLLLSMPYDFFPEGFNDFIKNKNWIYLKNNTIASAEKIHKSDISALYKFSDSDKDKLCNLLGIEEKMREIPLQHLDWRPSVAPDMAAANEDLHINKSLNFNPDLVSAANMSALLPAFSTNTRDDKKIYSDDDLEKIHLWSCNFVENILNKADGPDNCVIASSDCADMVIQKEGIVLKHIFVSGKTDLSGSFPLTSFQLSGIFKLFSVAENTWLYLVNSAGSKNVSFMVLKNPLDLLTKGKLAFNETVWISGFY